MNSNEMFITIFGIPIAFYIAWKYKSENINGQIDLIPMTAAIFIIIYIVISSVMDITKKR